MRPKLAQFGITRLARQTGLDRVGIPCWAAFRPNALTLSNSQGKGVDDVSACASALMEAIEFAVAENPEVSTERTSMRRLQEQGRRFLDLRRQMPLGLPIALDDELDFAEGEDFFTGELIMVPIDGVCIAARPSAPAGLARSTNGLASGNSAAEAVFHALCELVERDSTTLAGLSRPSRQLEVTPLSCFGDADLFRLEAKIKAAGLNLWLTEETSDLGVPCFRAVLGESTGSYFDISAGYGCHPVAARAALRAVTEAAQTRVTNIAGSRDDFLPQEYDRRGDEELLVRLNSAVVSRGVRANGVAADSTLEHLTAFLTSTLKDAGISVAVVSLGAERHGISVVKLLSPELEDRSPNRNWRPGQRALKAMGALQ
jgi:ribosomal protein S12 methylthiotransferase accessory factor